MLAGPMLRQRRPASSALSTLAVGTWADRLAAPARSARETIREPRTRAGKRFMRDSQVVVGCKFRRCAQDTNVGPVPLTRKDGERLADRGERENPLSAIRSPRSVPKTALPGPAGAAPAPGAGTEI